MKATTMIMYQSSHVFVVVHFNTYLCYHPPILSVFATYVVEKLMAKCIIVKLANLMHIPIVWRSKIMWMYFFMIILFIFLFKTITWTSPMLYVVFVRNQCNIANGCIGVNNVILMCMHFALSFQRKFTISLYIKMLSP